MSRRITRRTLALSLATLALLFVGLPSAQADPGDSDDQCPPGFYSIDGLAPCDAADPGYFVDGVGATEQTPCEIGTFARFSGSVACEDARAGFFVDSPMATSETPCTAGTYQPATGASECLDADPGYFAAGAPLDRQRPCGFGRYQPNSGSAGCFLADPGYFVDIDTATAQEPCPAGRYQPAPGAAGCLIAGAGFFAPGLASTSPTPCSPGTYAPAAESGACLNSAPGFFVAGQAATRQLPCSPGRFQPNQRSTSCWDAFAGNFVPGSASPVQNPCPLGQYQPTTAATSCLAADPGYFVDDTEATMQTPCPPGFFQPDTEATECLPAPVDTFVDGEAATEPTPCPPGQVQPLEGQTSCVDASLTIVLVAGTAGPPAADIPLVALIEAEGFDVEIVDDDSPDLADAVAALNPVAVVVSSTVVPTKVADELTDLAVPIIVSEAYLFDDFGITAGGFFQGETAPRNQLNIADPEHPIADGLSGRQFVTNVNRALNFGSTPNGTIVARDGATGRPVIVAFNAGDQMAGLTAPARRVALFTVWNSPQNLTEAGRALVANAIHWAADGAGDPPPPPPITPPEVDAGVDETVPFPLLFTTLNGDVGVTPRTPPFTLSWSGPEGVIFDDDGSLTPEVSFPGPGVYELTLTARGDGFTVSDTVLITVPGDDKVVGLVSSRPTGTPGDRTIISRIEAAGADVVIIDDDTAAAFDLSTIDALFISSSVSITKIGDLFKDAELPIAISEGYLFDDMGMALRSRESPPKSQIVITEPADPLAAGFMGTQTVYSAANGLSVAVLAGDAESIAHEPSVPQRSALFRYAAGTELADGGVAADHRIGYFPNYFGGQRLTAVGRAILDAVIDEILAAAGDSGL